MKVTEGVLAYTHSFKHTIQEIYVPKYNASINLGIHGSELNIFKTRENRYGEAEKIGEREVPDYIQEIIKKHLEAREGKDDVLKWMGEEND